MNFCWKKMTDAWVPWVVLGTVFGSLLILL